MPTRTIAISMIAPSVVTRIEIEMGHEIETEIASDVIAVVSENTTGMEIMT